MRNQIGGYKLPLKIGKKPSKIVHKAECCGRVPPNKNVTTDTTECGISDSFYVQSFSSNILKPFYSFGTKHTMNDQKSIVD